MAERTALQPLTSLRFLAAFLVVLHHYAGFSLGYSGVTFFFILSGFILSFNYQGKVNDRADRSLFYLKRFARIYPTHLLTLSAAVPFLAYELYRGGFQPAATTVGLVTAAANVMLLQSWSPSMKVYFGLNAVSWSISDEAFFYALFPLMAGWMGRLPLRRMWAGLAAWSVALLLLALGWWMFWRTSTLEDGTTHWLFYINPVIRLFEFVLGMGMAITFLNTRRRQVSIAGEFGVLLLTAASFVLPLLFSVPGPILASLWFIPSACALILLGSGDGPIARRLSHPALLLLGEASFMLYMIHALALRYATALLGDFWWVRGGLLAAVVPVAILLHLKFEKPMQRLVLGRRKMREIAATAP